MLCIRRGMHMLCIKQLNRYLGVRGAAECFFRMCGVDFIALWHEHDPASTCFTWWKCKDLTCHELMHNRNALVFIFFLFRSNSIYLSILLNGSKRLKTPPNPPQGDTKLIPSLHWNVANSVCEFRCQLKMYFYNSIH